MKRLAVRRRAKKRAGFTWIELVFVILGVILLLSLMLPAVSSGPVSKVVGCSYDLKHLALANCNYATSYNGQLPYLADKPPGLCDPSLYAPNNIPKTVSFHIPLLPYLDNAGAIEYIETQTTAREANQALRNVLTNTFKAFTCPADSNHVKKPGGISYVANCGYGEFEAVGTAIKATDFRPHSASLYNAWDLIASNGVSKLDKSISRATGLFWLPDQDDWRRTLDDVVNGDGSGQTLMLSENTNAGFLIDAGTNPMLCGFVVGRTAINFTKVAPRYLAFSTIATPFPFQINSNLGKAIGKSPVPSSFHKGGVNAAFCDGHIKFLSETIDPSVYVRLMSPNGIRYGQADLKDDAY